MSCGNLEEHCTRQRAQCGWNRVNKGREVRDEIREVIGARSWESFEGHCRTLG